LQLASAAGGDQNVTIVAVEAFDQFHGFSPLLPGCTILIAEIGALRSFVCDAKGLLYYFPTKPRVVGAADRE
jgi:hypothetical protein